MSEMQASLHEADTNGQAAQAGALLRQAREAAGLHVAALAVALKVPVKKLEALEAGRIDLLPDAVFARGLASSVCRTLKLDPAPVLELLPQLGKPRIKTDESNINAPFRASSTPTNTPWQTQLTRPVVAGVAVLLVGAVILLLLPRLELELPSSKPDPVLPPQSGEPAVAPPNDAVVAAPAVAPAVALTPAVPAGPVVPTKPVAQAPAAAAPPVPAPAAPSPAGAAAALAADGILVFQPRSETWVQVIDAKGVVALRKTLAAGETTGISGALPLSVIIGRADATVVQVRGKAMDLAPLSKDNVARFEVK